MNIIIILLKAAGHLFATSITYRLGNYLNPDEDSEDGLSLGVMTVCVALGALALGCIGYLVSLFVDFGGFQL